MSMILVQSFLHTAMTNAEFLGIIIFMLRWGKQNAYSILKSIVKLVHVPMSLIMVMEK